MPLICLKFIFLHSFQCGSFQRQFLITVAASLILLVGLAMIPARKRHGKRRKYSSKQSILIRRTNTTAKILVLGRSAGSSVKFLSYTELSPFFNFHRPELRTIVSVKFKNLSSCLSCQLRWFPSQMSHHRFPMKLGMLMLQDKEILKT